MATNQAVMKVPQELQGLRPAGAYTFDELYRLAQVCHASGLFGDVKDAAQAMIKIVKGQELGFPPTTAMSAFDIISRQIFIKPWAIAAKINSCGYGSYRVQLQTTECCTIVFSRKGAGRGWEDLEPVSYTIAEAHAHGLVQRSPHWKASPANMLYQRCMGRGGAKYFPELLAGMLPPRDDTPVTSAERDSHIADLFGDVLPQGPPPTGGAASRVETPAPSSMWQETVAAHLDRMPEPFQSQCAAALKHPEDLSESDGFTLASQVLDILDHEGAEG
jgi:hypothetical protein